MIAVGAYRHNSTYGYVNTSTCENGARRKDTTSTHTYVFTHVHVHSAHPMRLARASPSDKSVSSHSSCKLGSSTATPTQATSSGRCRICTCSPSLALHSVSLVNDSFSFACYSSSFADYFFFSCINLSVCVTLFSFSLVLLFVSFEPPFSSPIIF